MAAFATTIQYAIRAGEALLAARELTKPEGIWESWLAEHFPKNRSTAYTYMRVAAYQHRLPPSTTEITQADRLLKGLPDINGGPPRLRIPDERKKEAKQMRKGGRSYKEIAKHLEVSVSTVYAWFNGGARKSRERARRSAEAQQEKERVIRKAVRQKGGAIAEAYSMVERLDDVLAQAHREAEEPEARRSLSHAHEHHHAMRDFVVKALGVEP